MSEQLTDLAAIAGVVIGSSSLLWQIARLLGESKPQIDMDLECERLINLDDGHLVKIDSTVSNLGKSRLLIDKSRLFVDEGWMVKDGVVFPKLWVWDKSCPDCKLSVWCKTDAGISYPNYVSKEEIDGKLVDSIELDHLARAIEYVTHGERFTETKVISLPTDKFFRITFITIPKKHKILKIFKRKIDCLCMYRILPPITKQQKAEQKC